MSSDECTASRKALRAGHLTFKGTSQLKSKELKKLQQRLCGDDGQHALGNSAGDAHASVWSSSREPVCARKVDAGGVRLTCYCQGAERAMALEVGDAARGGVRGGAELSTILHKVTGDGYLHTLAPRVSASADVMYEETDETPIPLDAIDDPYDGAIYEAGLRALWVRPATFENFDLDVRGILRTDRERGLEDRTELGVLTEYITRYGRGVGQIGLRHDGRYDMESGETIFSRSALAIRPDEDFIAELQYSQARAVDTFELYETAGLLTRWRADPKWEVEARYVHDLLTDQQLLMNQ